LRIIPVITNQADLGTRASRELMSKVKTFINEVRSTWTDGAPPKVMVTGRTPYVAEMSATMLFDVASTLVTSLAIVALIFAVGFRRIRPLVAIVHVLLLACLAAVAVGGVFLGELNLITIGFCSILVGLGVDFGMLLFGNYQSCRDHGESHEQAVAHSLKHLSVAVFFGAITTAAAFLCLLRSDTAGFAQLGVLIAVGICFAAALMMTTFFTLIGDKHRPTGIDPLRATTLGLVDGILPRSRTVLLVSTSVLAALTAMAFLPIGYLHFDVDPKSLEPEKSNAGDALRAIKSKIPAAEIEPILVIVDAPDAETASSRWAALGRHWNNLVERGVIRSFTTPSAFAVSEKRQLQNASRLDAATLDAAEVAFAQTLEDQGFSTEGFQPAFDLIEGLKRVAGGSMNALDWRNTLPISSTWWFVLDRFFSDRPGIGAGYIMPTKAIT
jgi:predicted exporter